MLAAAATATFKETATRRKREKRARTRGDMKGANKAGVSPQTWSINTKKRKKEEKNERTNKYPNEKRQVEYQLLKGKNGGKKERERGHRRKRTF